VSVGFVFGENGGWVYNSLDWVAAHQEILLCAPFAKFGDFVVVVMKITLLFAAAAAFMEKRRL